MYYDLVQTQGQESLKIAEVIADNDIAEIKRRQTEKVEQLTSYLRLEADFSRSNHLITDIIDNMPDAFYVLDSQWLFAFINKKAEELLLHPREDLIGKTFWEAFPQARGTLVATMYQKVMSDCVPITFESLSLIHENRWYQVTAFPFQSGLSVYYREITAEKLEHENLIKSQEEVNSILESMTDCFFALDRDWRFTYINRAGEIVLGKPRHELLGKILTEEFTFHETALRHYHIVMNEKRSVSFELFSENFGNIWIEESVYPTETGLSCYFRDITGRKIADKELARLDRLNLVGQLAAGIGHEIRNPMTTVRGYLQLLGEKPLYADQKATFELMISELDQANSIITEFLSLAQTKLSVLKAQTLNDILGKLYPLLEADAFTQNKQLSIILGKTPNLDLNGKEITQLVFNLARNGLEAMGERGVLTIRSYVEADKVVLAIEDEGCGIPPENLDKLGIPFFTTKDNGTGLGLATCYKIADSHHAEVRVNSSSSGTKFQIVFPIPE